VANRLTQDGTRSVVLLESGGSDLSPYVQFPAGLVNISPKNFWHYELEPDATRNGRVDTWAAGRILGGGSSVNAMLWVRGNPADFDIWAELGAKGWDYQGVLPYMRSAETFEDGASEVRGGAGPQRVSRVRMDHPLVRKWIKGAQEAGYPFLNDYNAGNQLGVGVSQLSQRNGMRHSTARAFLAPARRRKNLEVRERCTVRRVIFEGTRAVGVEYERSGHLATVLVNEEVILCAGALASPELLLRSGIGPANDLRELGIDVVADVPGVGKNLQEHPAVSMTFNVTQRTLNQELNLWGSIKAASSFVFQRRGPITSPLAHAMMFGPLDSSRGQPVFHILMAPLGTVADKPHATAEELEGANQNSHDKQGVKLSRESIVSAYLAPVHPRARGELRLRNTDPSTPPIIDFPMLSDIQDIRDLTAGCRTVREIFNTPTMSEVVVAENPPTRGLNTDEEWEEYIRDHAFGGSHWVGTARMGADDDSAAVVDPQLRVRGVVGLRVIDASVMPTLTSGNTNAPTIMVAEKGAATILGR